MKRTLIALGTLASIAVLSDTAWAGCMYGGDGCNGRRPYLPRGAGVASALVPPSAGCSRDHRRCYCHPSPIPSPRTA